MRARECTREREVVRQSHFLFYFFHKNDFANKIKFEETASTLETPQKKTPKTMRKAVLVRAQERID